MEEETTEIAERVMNALFRCQTMSGLRPSKAAVEIMEDVLKLGLRCEAPTRAFFHFLLAQKTSKGDQETFDAARDMKAWDEISSQRFNKDQKATYLHHMSEVMGKRERQDWDFLFNEPAWQKNLSANVSNDFTC